MTFSLFVVTDTQKSFSNNSHFSARNFWKFWKKQKTQKCEYAWPSSTTTVLKDLLLSAKHHTASDHELSLNQH